VAQRTACHQCTASIGVALFDAFTPSSAEVLKQADSAMYAAKTAGRNCIRTHSGS
jgi:GGDEF domain-containing protein